MLSDDDINLIGRKAYRFDHEWHLWSIFAGEPFLICNSLCYFDGTVLQINGHTLEPNSPCEKPIESILTTNPLFKSASFVWYWGPWEKGSLGDLSEFHVIDYSDPSPLYPGHILTLKDFSLESLPKAKRDIKKLRNKEWIVRLTPSKILGIEHIRLVKLFFSSHQVSLTEWSMLWSLQAQLGLEHMQFFEVRKADRLAGFALVSTLFPKRPICVYAFFDRSIPGATDILHYELIQWAIANGAEYVHMGTPLGNEGVYRYKLKWGSTLEDFPSFTYGLQSTATGEVPNACQILPTFHLGWAGRLARELLGSLDKQS